MKFTFEQKELFDLCGAVADERATANQIDRLKTILDGNRAAQRHYSTFMMIHAELFWQLDSLSTDERDVGASSPKTSILANLAADHSAKAGPDVKAGPGALSRLTLAAMLTLGAAVGMILVWASTPENSPPDVAIKHSENGDHPQFGELVARVTGTRNCRWENAEKEDKRIGFDSPVYAGQTLRLSNGLAEITFLNGVQVILQAPARLDLSSLDRSVLHEGKLTASVPKGAEGFQVACRGITIVDRGTEFGLNTTKSGETEVRVFEGLVDAFFETGNKGPFRKVSWKKNDSAKFHPGTGEITAVEHPSNFVRSLSQKISSQQGVLASEDFDYAVGQLAGQEGGYGWGSPWDNISVEAGKQESNEVEAGSIECPGIDNVGNRAVLTGNFNRIRRILSTSFSGVFDTAGLIENQDGARLVGRDGKTIYISFTQCVDKADDVFYGFELNRGDGNANRVLCIGHAAARAWIEGPPRRPDKSAGVTGWSVTSEFNGHNDRLLDLGNLGPPIAEPVLVVMRIDFGEKDQDRVAVYVDPQSLENETGCIPVVTGMGNFAFDRIGLANFEGSKRFEIDHIRIGTAFSAVTQRTNDLELVAQLPNDENSD